MPIINPDGLFRGERLARCSDDAQLHWVRLFTASNTFGRLELSYQNIIFIAYRNIRTKPTEAEIAGWIQEYFDNFLLFVYDCEDGSTWGQWLTDAKFLSTYQTAADRRSPAPDAKALEAYRRRYISSKKSKSLRINRLSEPLQTTSNHNEPDHTVSAYIEKPADEGVDENDKNGKSLEINTVSEPHQTVSLGIGIGIGIGVKQEQKQQPCPAEERRTGVCDESVTDRSPDDHRQDASSIPPDDPPKPSSPPLPAPASDWPPVPAHRRETPEELIYQEYPRKEGHLAAIKSINIALRRIQKGEGVIPAIPDQREARIYLYRRVQTYARSPAGSQPDKTRIPHPKTWFDQARYLDDESNWQRTGEIRYENPKHIGTNNIAVLTESLRKDQARADANGDLSEGDAGQCDLGTLRGTIVERKR